jgi:membrane associated rhomboid family serine protease
MFVAIPVGMNYRTERLPIVTLSLIGVNTLVWLVSLIFQVSTDGDSQVWIMKHLWLVPAYCTWYAPFTAMFVHAGIMHLVGNMVYLFLFGSCVEDLIGRLRFTVFYLVCGLVADVVYIAMNPEHYQSSVPMCGASGAISGCLGMYLLLRAGVAIEFRYFLWFFYVRAGEFEIPAWVAITFWFGEDLLFAVLGMVLPAAGRGGVAFGAHVGGFLGGLGLVAAYRWLESRHAGKSRASGVVLDPQSVLPTRVTPSAQLPGAAEIPAIFLHDGQQQTGPFTLSAIQAMLQRREIGPETSYWSQGMAEWESVLELAGQPME